MDRKMFWSPKCVKTVWQWSFKHSGLWFIESSRMTRKIFQNQTNRKSNFLISCAQIWVKCLIYDFPVSIIHKNLERISNIVVSTKFILKISVHCTPCISITITFPYIITLIGDHLPSTLNKHVLSVDPLQCFRQMQVFSFNVMAFHLEVCFLRWDLDRIPMPYTDQNTMGTMKMPFTVQIQIVILII